MKKSVLGILSAVLILGLFFVPKVAHAHEVYVLSKAEIAADVALPPLNLWPVAVSHENQFLLSGLLGILAILIVLGVSLSRDVERWIDPILFKIKPYASHLAQITFGCALIASAYHGALFGTELPFTVLFGTHVALVTIALYAAGTSVLLGVVPQVGSVVAIVIFCWAVSVQGIYMLSYGTYLGEGLIVLLFGGGYALFRSSAPSARSALMTALEKRKSFILRIFFSASLIYAALYAKLIHGQLALNTVLKYHLTNYFHFDPLFIVLGAFMIEMSIGLFYLLGFEIRFTSLFFLTFLTMSLIFFGEAVWPHIVLIGTAVTLFVHGYDDYTIEHRWYASGMREPVL